MKYRLLELLRCPDHQNDMLQVRGAQVSEVFPCSEELQIPVCRAGCGYLGNWFTDIPESLPPHHRFDCRRCLGTEIESAVLTCSEGDWTIEVSDGVVMPKTNAPEVEAIPETPISRKTAALIRELLGLQKGDIALILVPMPESVLQELSGAGVEILHADLQHEVLAAGRALSCTNGHGMVHHLTGPLGLRMFRDGNFDAMLIPSPSSLIADWPDSLELVPSLLKPSGKLLLLYPRNGPKKPALERLRSLTLKLPQEFDGLNIDLSETPDYDILVVSHPEPENGNGLAKMQGK